MALSKEQVEILIAIERTTASISVIATLILCTSFIFIRAFRTLSNTLIFYASFANLFANVAALIGGSALSDVDSPLCQFQGFLLEMFMQSDPMWSCAMAVNVYLVFFRRYDATRLKKLYWIYGVICYGLPFIPAMFCLFYKSRGKGKMYGNATLWCWIENGYAPVRIYSYYAPIWVSILTALVIYVRVGVEIFQKRSQLRAAAYSSKTNQYETGTMPSVLEKKVDVEVEAEIVPAPFSGVRTTEIEVSTDAWTLEPLKSPSVAYVGDGPEKNSSGSDTDKSKSKDQYSVTISSVHVQPEKKYKTARFKRTNFMPRKPSSMDKIKWAYTKCALLFAISILITWVPASINRVWGLRNPHNPSFALNVGSALVLPLQGFWNTVIYFMTSMSITRNCWAEFKENHARNRERKSSMKFNRKLDIQHLGGKREGGPSRGIAISGLGMGRGVSGGRGERLGVKQNESEVELSRTGSVSVSVTASTSRRDDSDSS